jgi:uncharacterized integral membrane protein
VRSVDGRQPLPGDSEVERLVVRGRAGPVRNPPGIRFLQKGKPIMKPKGIFLLVLALLVFVVIIQNAGVASFNILFWHLSMSRIIWLLLFVAVGFAAGYILCSLRHRAGR